MTERRDVLKMMSVAALGLTSAELAVGSILQKSARGDTASAETNFDPRMQRRIPDVAGITHTGKRIQFYRDLIKDKVALIHFMSIAGESGYPVTGRMATIAQRLGGKLGRDVFMISVTRDPLSDTPERLAAFAEKFGNFNGWNFVNLNVEGTDAMTDRIYHSGHQDRNIANQKRRTADIVFYGNGAVGLWSTFPVDIQPDDAVRRVGWVMPGKSPEGKLSRGGPRRLDATGLSSDNRIA